MTERKCATNAIHGLPVCARYGATLCAVWLVLFGSVNVARAQTVASRPAVGVFAGNGQPAHSDKTAPLSGVRSNDDEPSDSKPIAMGNPFGVEVIGDDVWITTVDDQCVWKTSLSGEKIARVAGSGEKGYRGDDGPATEAAFNWPHEVRVDDEGNLFIADTRNHVIRRVDADSNVVTTIAGDGTEGFAGDGDSGSAVRFSQPHSVVLDRRGGLLVADTKNHRLRRIDLKTKVVTTIAGNGKRQLPNDGGIAKSCSLFGPRSLAVDDSSIWIALREGNSIWRIDRRNGTIHHVAGTGKKGYSGDDGDPLQATFSGPKGIAIDRDGNLLIVDTENHAVRKIDFATNVVTTILGGTVAKQTTILKRPHGIAATKGKALLLLGDSENHRVVYVD